MSRNHERPPSDQLADVHVCVIPPELWRENLNSAVLRLVDEAVSAGFVRVPPDLSLYQMREEIDNQLGYDVIPRDYLYLRNVGRCLTKVQTKQEYTLKIKHFRDLDTRFPEVFVVTSAVCVPVSGSSSRLSDNRLRHSNNYPDTSRSNRSDFSGYKRVPPIGSGANGYGQPGQTVQEESPTPHDIQQPSNHQTNLPEAHESPPESPPCEQTINEATPVLDGSTDQKGSEPDISKAHLSDYDSGAADKPLDYQEGPHYRDPRQEDRRYDPHQTVPLSASPPASRDLFRDPKKDNQDYLPPLSATPPRSPDLSHKPRQAKYTNATSDDSGIADEDEYRRQRQRQAARRQFEEEERRRQDDDARRRRLDDDLRNRKEELEEMERRHGHDDYTTSWDDDHQERERRQWEDERKRRDEEDNRRKREEDNRRRERKEEDERLQRDEDRRRQEEERWRKEDDERLQRQEDERRRQEEERWRKEEDKRLQREVEKRRQEEDKQRREDEDKKLIEDRRRRNEQDQKQRQEEQDRKREAERRRKPNERFPSPPRPPPSSRVSKQKSELTVELDRLRDDRQTMEKKREELIKKCKQLQNKTHGRRNQARDVWKKKYYEEKKKTPPLEEKCNKLRQELGNLHRRIMSQLETTKDDKVRRSTDKPSQQPLSDESNHKIQATKLQHEIDDLQRRVENIKMKLTAEMKLRNQAETELRALRAELTQKKIGMTLTRGNPPSRQPDLYQARGNDSLMT